MSTVSSNRKQDKTDVRESVEKANVEAPTVPTEKCVSESVCRSKTGPFWTGKLISG